MKKKILILISVLFSFFAFSEETPVKGLFQNELKNGLQVFVAENHTVPLVYIEIAVKCGAFTQEKSTSGLFHLYEHMMFKGNKKFKNAQEVNKAFKDLGTTSWNGTTNIECVNYFFTIPKEQLKEGLEFWSEAIRNPLLDKKELENEKKVVLSEIQSDSVESGRLFFKDLCKTLFPGYDYKFSSAGDPDVVRNATVDQLKKIQKKFYISNNSAVFVGGDVNPDEVFALVKEVFGDWKKAPSPFKKNLMQYEKNPLENPVYKVMPFEKIAKDQYEVSVDFRGADAFYEPDDVFSLDMIFQCVSNPNGHFKKFFVDENKIGIPDVDSVYGYYSTRRFSGQIEFGANFTSQNENMIENAKFFAENIYDSVKTMILEQDEKSISVIKQRLKDNFIYATETPQKLLSNLRFYWISSSVQDFYYYNENMAEVTKEEMLSCAEFYLGSLNPVVTILLNPEDFKEKKSEFLENGFSIIENSYTK